MRTLTRQQKKELKKWFNKNYDGDYKFKLADKIDNETYRIIENLNPTEIHYQNVNHYLEKLVDDEENKRYLCKH